MSEEIFTERERAEICVDPFCEEHGDGDAPCNVPRTKEEAKRKLKAESTVSLQQQAEPKTAKGIVERTSEG